MAMSIKERNDLVLSNLGLIKKIANNYSKKGYDKDDSFMDGIEKFLMIAADFDPSKNCTLSTYIWPHILNHITELNEDAPVSMRKHFKKILDAREYLEGTCGHSVNTSEIAEFLGTTEKKIHKYEDNINKYKTISLTPVSDDDDNKEFSYLDTFLDNPYKSPEDLFMEKEDMKALKMAWNELDDEEREILSYRTTYGTKLSKELSLRKIAEIMGSNRTTVGNKEKMATSHLKRILDEYGFGA